MDTFKIATYQAETGPRAGIILGDQIHDAATLLHDSRLVTVLDLLEQWDRVEGELAATTPPANGGQALANVTLRAPLLYPSAIYCAGANYQDHMDAVAKHRGLAPQPSPRDLGLGPFFFLKTPRSIVGPDADVAKTTPALDFEIELAVVIGRVTRGVSVDDALQYVAGYSIANDLSARNRILRHQLDDSSPFKYDWNSHKNFDGSCPLGPWIVPATSVPDPQALVMKTWVNGALRQNSTTAKMIFSAAEQISAISQNNTLYPGDVILTGTPEGVGAESSTWLNTGDKIVMEIENIGELSTSII